jgi:hypothetical protein
MSDLRDVGAKFILRMKEGLCLSQQTCDEMVSGVKILLVTTCLPPTAVNKIDICFN